jgi:hypothetical protein
MILGSIVSACRLSSAADYVLWRKNLGTVAASGSTVNLAGGSSAESTGALASVAVEPIADAAVLMGSSNILPMQECMLAMVRGAPDPRPGVADARIEGGLAAKTRSSRCSDERTGYEHTAPRCDTPQIESTRLEVNATAFLRRSQHDTASPRHVPSAAWIAAGKDGCTGA